MGFPLTSYTLLKELRKNTPHILRNFHLYAFVLHDPETHNEFHQAMEENFEMLDQITGKKVLFFTLLNPSDTWLNRAAERLYLDCYYYQNNHCTGDERLAAYALAKELGIPLNELPCIVVTDCLDSRKFAWFKTDGDAISRQLGILALAAESSVDEAITLDVLVRNYGKKLGILYYCHTGILSETVHIADALINVLAVTNINDDATREQVKNTLNQLVLKFQNLKRNSQGYSDSRFDSVCMKLATYLAQLEPGVPDFSLVTIDSRYLDEESRVFSQTANNLYQYFEKRRSLIDMLDHTPIAICLFKIFEHEINLSVVQWIRKELQIELPRFYNKPDGFRKVIYDCGNFTINFNKSCNWRLIYPGIGQTRRVLIKMQKEKKQWIVEQKFLHEWDVIANYRNLCAHTEVISSNFVDDFKIKLDWFIKEGFFECLYHIKTAMATKGEYFISR